MYHSGTFIYRVMFDKVYAHRVVGDKANAHSFQRYDVQNPQSKEFEDWKEKRKKKQGDKFTILPQPMVWFLIMEIVLLKKANKQNIP